MVGSSGSGHGSASTGGSSPAWRWKTPGYSVGKYQGVRLRRPGDCVGRWIAGRLTGDRRGETRPVVEVILVVLEADRDRPGPRHRRRCRCRCGFARRVGQPLLAPADGRMVGAEDAQAHVGQVPVVRLGRLTEPVGDRGQSALDRQARRMLGPGRGNDDRVGPPELRSRLGGLPRLRAMVARSTISGASRGLSRPRRCSATARASSISVRDPVDRHRPRPGSGPARGPARDRRSPPAPGPGRSSSARGCRHPAAVPDPAVVPDLAAADLPRPDLAAVDLPRGWILRRRRILTWCGVLPRCRVLPGVGSGRGVESCWRPSLAGRPDLAGSPGRVSGILGGWVPGHRR